MMPATSLLAPALSAAILSAPTGSLDAGAAPGARGASGDAATHVVSFVELPSNAELFEPVNETLLIDLATPFGLPVGTPTLLTGLGWEIEVDSVGESWMAEAILWFSPPGDLEAETAFFLQPGNMANFPGTQTFASGGIVPLINEDFPGLILPDGMLRIEFFETFDDETFGEPGGPAIADAFLSGSLTLQGEEYIPAPGSAAALLLAGAGLVCRRRRGR